MTRKLADFIAEGRRLSAEEREIAARALTTLDPAEQAEVDAAWAEEIGLRAQEVMDGTVMLVNGDETRSLGRERLRERRR